MRWPRTGAPSARVALGAPVVLALLTTLAIGFGAVGACGGSADKFVGSWAVDNPMPQTKRLAMTITKAGDTYKIDPTEGISNASVVPAKVQNGDLVGTVKIPAGDLELRFKPGSDPDKLELSLTMMQVGGQKVSFTFTLQRVKE
jgi:hypothetical protein